MGGPRIRCVPPPLGRQRRVKRRKSGWFHHHSPDLAQVHGARRVVSIGDIEWIDCALSAITHYVREC